MKKTWIIVSFSTQDEQVEVYRVIGNEEQIKKYLINMIKDERHCDPDKYEFGCESSDSISENELGYLYAYASYEGYTINYYAVPEEEPLDLDNRKQF